MKTAILGPAARYLEGASADALRSGLVVGVSGSSRNACATLGTSDGVLGICSQERVTRVRGAGCNGTGLPDEAINALLARAGRQKTDITAYALAEPSAPLPDIEPSRVSHHFAHACAAFLPSPFDAATIVVCDHESPQISVWEGDGTTITPVEWPWTGTGFAELLSDCARAVGFTTPGREQRLEALARLDPDCSAEWALHLFALDDDRIRTAPDWQSEIERRAAGLDRRQQASVAAALQARLGALVVEFLARVQRRVGTRQNLCVGGSLFCNSYVNSTIKQSGLFERTFVPVDPANGGLSPGVALHAVGVRQRLTPFLGPCYSTEEIKATLDNCKLTYQWASEEQAIGFAVDVLHKGQLLAWFDGPMEWGPRALGARSILASPFSPYVLDNLNRFLKHRDEWRGYALSVPEAAVPAHFDGPGDSPFMECDYAPRDRARFQHVLPGPRASVRVHAAGADTPSRFLRLLHAFGETSGVPTLVNTSFNGLHEPIVCSPRDAIRVFYGTGLDVLVLDQFIIRK
jgi:carbamoyltransferase